MHKRTLSGSEQLAHSKNRHEERHLKERLEQLAYFEFQSRDQNRVETQKWRQFLRDNNKSSGWSPMAMRPDTDEQNDYFDFSARFHDGSASPTSPRRRCDPQFAEKFQRPWAYTFNSESHNKVYRELALAGENSKKMHKVVSPTGSGAASSSDYPRLAQHVTAVTGLERAKSAWSRCSDRMLPARSVQIPPRPKTSAEETCFVEYSDLSGNGTDLALADASPRYKLERQVSKLSSVTRAKSAWIKRGKNSSQLDEPDDRPATVDGSRGDHIPKLARSVTMLSGLCKSKDIWICSVCGGDTRAEKDKEKFAYTALVYKGLQRAKSVLERLKSPTDTKDSEGEEKTEEERPSTPRANRCSCGCKKSKGNNSSQGSALLTPRSRQSKGKINTQGVPNSTRLQTGMPGKNKSNETPRNSPRQMTNKKPALEKCRSISVTNMGAKENSGFGKNISLPATVNNSWSEINERLKENKGNCKDASADIRERKISTQCNKICEASEIISNGKTESASIQNKQRFGASPNAKALRSENSVIDKTGMTTRDTQQESNGEISVHAGNSPVAQPKFDCGGENSPVDNIPGGDAKTVFYQQARNQCERNREKITGSGLSEQLSGRPECQTFGQRKTDGSIDSSQSSENINTKQSNQVIEQTVARQKKDSKCVKGTEGTEKAKLENRSESVDTTMKDDIMQNISDVLQKKIIKDDETKDKVGSEMKLYRGRPAGRVGRRSTAYSTSEMVVFIKRVRNKVKDKQLRREDNVFYKIARVMLEKQKALRAERAAAAVAAKAKSDADVVGSVTSGENVSNGDRKPSTTTAPASGSNATRTRPETMKRSVSVTQDKADNSANHSNGPQGNSYIHKPHNVNDKNDRRFSSENSRLNYTKIQDRNEDNENRDPKTNNSERNRKISMVNNNNDANCNNTYLTRSTPEIINNNANGRPNEVITETDTYNNDDMESTSPNMASIIQSIENQSKTNGADGDWANSDLKGLFSNRFTEHKGVKIRNYVSPHLRYKTAARDRQRREISVRWHVSEGAMVTSHQYQDRPKSSGVVFPKHARSKALAKMVEENHAQPINNAAQLADAELRRRIDQFLTSVEPYCQSPRE